MLWNWFWFWDAPLEQLDISWLSPSKVGFRVYNITDEKRIWQTLRTWSITHACQCCQRCKTKDNRVQLQRSWEQVFLIHQRCIHATLFMLSEAMLTMGFHITEGWPGLYIFRSFVAYRAWEPFQNLNCSRSGFLVAEPGVIWWVRLLPSRTCWAFVGVWNISGIG